MATPLRLALFIDAQNAYRRARACFFPEVLSGVHGQFDPVRLGHLIAVRNNPSGIRCALSEVRIYSGRPDQRRDPRTYAAHRNQIQRWADDGAAVITRMLRYPRTWPTEPAQEKGIDVALALDFVDLAARNAYDVGVIMSTDNDLLPAVEMVRTRHSEAIRVAVAAWRSEGSSQRLRLPGLWCHWLDEADYWAVADSTRY